MYAIVTIAGQQFKVTEGQNLYVHQLEANVGDSKTFDQVLLIERDAISLLASRCFQVQKSTLPY